MTDPTVALLEGQLSTRLRVRVPHGLSRDLPENPRPDGRLFFLRRSPLTVVARGSRGCQRAREGSNPAYPSMGTNPLWPSLCLAELSPADAYHDLDRTATRLERTQGKRPDGFRDIMALTA